MAGSVKGILVEIGGDTSGLQKALKKVNSESSSLSKELKGINSLLKLDPKNTELLAQKQTVLTSNIKETEQKLKLLKQAQKEADETIKNGGEISQENYRNLQREIISTENKLKNLNKEYKNFLTETSKLTQAGKSMQEIGEKVEKGSKKISELGSNIISKATTGVIGLATVAVTAGASLEASVDKYISKTNKSIEETEKYKKVLTDINDANFGEGYEDIANSMAIVEQQMRGLDDAADLENITKKAYYLKDAFDAEINESVRAAKMMMEQWGLSANEAFELINQGYQKGLDKNGDLLDSINEYSVHFRQIGLSATDMFNTFSLGAESGAFSIDKVGDAIKEMGIRLKDGSATDALKAMKLNANDLEKAFAEGGEKGSAAFGKIVKGLQNIKDPLKQNQAGVAIFGTMWEDLGKDAVFAMTSYGEEFDETMNTMNASMDKMYNNTKGNTEATIKRIKTISANLGTKLLPIVNKVLDKAEVFIEKLDNLSDSEQDNIINIGLLVAGAGPLIKVVGTAGTVIGKTSKGIGIFSQSLSVAKNNSTSTSKSVNSLANIFKSLTSPAGLATTAILATAGAVLYLENKETEAQKASREFAEEMANSKKELDNYNKSIDDATSAELAHIDAVSNLKDELSTLVDENGKVKDGEQGRVSFILNELNDALGTEYNLNGDIIDSYKKLQDEIQGTIDKKKAKIKLDAEEKKYSNAINNQSSYVEDLKKAQEEIDKTGMSYETLTKTISQWESDWADYKSKEGLQPGLAKSTDLMLKYTDKEIEALKNKVKAYNDASYKIEECNNEIKSYEEDYVKFTEGKYDEVGKSIIVTTKKWCNETLDTIKNSINEQGNNLKQYEKIYKDKGDAIAKQNAEQAKKNLEDLATELADRTSRIENLGEDEISAWKTLGEQSYSVYEENLCKLSPTMAQNIQNATGVIIRQTPYVVEKTQSMSQQIVEKLDKNAEFRAQAVSNLQGFLNGMSDDNLRDLLNQAGVQDVEKVMEGIRKGNLAEEEGVNILKSLNNGLQNSSFTGTLFATAKKVAESISNGLEIKPKVSVFSFTSKLPGHKNGLDYVPKDNYVARLHKGERVLTAEENKEYTKMLEDLKIPNYSRLQSNLATKMMSTSNTRNINNTIDIKIYPQSLNDSEINSLFDKINRKLGKLY